MLYTLTCEVERDIPADRTLLSHRHFAEDVLRTFEMCDCIPALSPMKPGTRLTKEQSNPSPDPAFHRRYYDYTSPHGARVSAARLPFHPQYAALRGPCGRGGLRRKNASRFCAHAGLHEARQTRFARHALSLRVALRGVAVA